ncbi:MAG: hypothetical protein R6U32_01420 [Candidatus Woesearchaeota archaeon]
MARKGQAAMEFLMTYGWAILVVLVVIGALAYFGVLNPARLLPDKCTATPGITCEDYQISTGEVKAKLSNGMGKAMKIDGVSFESTDAECTADTSGIVDETWESGKEMTFTASCSESFTSGGKGKGTFTIKYYTGTNSDFTHEVSVEVASTVQE